MEKKIQSPGAFLQVMLKKYRMDTGDLAEALKLSSALIRLIANDKAKITVSVAFRLSKLFNTVPEYWLSIQMKYDISEAEKDKELQKALKAIARIKKPVGKAPNEAKKAAPAKAAPAKTASRGRKPAAAKAAPAKAASRGRKPAAAKAVGKGKKS